MHDQQETYDLHVIEFLPMNLEKMGVGADMLTEFLNLESSYMLFLV